MDHPPSPVPLSSPTRLAFLASAMLWIGAVSAGSQKPQQDRSQDDSPGIHWRTDQKAARRDALAEHKPILWYYRCDP